MSNLGPSMPPRPPGHTQRREPLRLHIGGEEPRPGWKILNALPGPHVDFLGNALDLSQFADNSVLEIYASHIYEHLSHCHQVVPAMREAHRVLEPGGVLRVSVPDLDILCQIFLRRDLNPEGRYRLMAMFYGGHTNPFDYHKAGFNFDLLGSLLAQIGFQSIRRVEAFNLFNDTSTFRFGHIPISLNVMAMK